MQDQALETIYITEETAPKPDLNTKFPRLYGHHNCPFVEKARLAFAARNHVYQKVEVDLGKKTEWHKEINGGLVPIYEMPDGTVLLESKILMDFAEEAFPDQGYSTLPSDPVLRAKLRLAIPLSEQLFSAFYTMFMKKTFDEQDTKNIKAKLQAMEDFLAQNAKEGSPFALGTENPTQLDIHFYPVIARIEYFRDSVFHDELFTPIDLDSYTHIMKLFHAFQARPEFKNAITQRRPHQQYLEEMKKTPPGHKVQLFVPYELE
eukprot:403348572